MKNLNKKHYIQLIDNLDGVLDTLLGIADDNNQFINLTGWHDTINDYFCELELIKDIYADEINTDSELYQAFFKFKQMFLKYNEFNLKYLKMKDKVDSYLLNNIDLNLI